MELDPRFLRKSKEPSRNEFCIIIQVLRFMDSLPRGLLFDFAPSRREQLQRITGVSNRIAQRSMDYLQNDDGFNGDTPPNEPTEGTKRGRKKKPVDDEQVKRLKTTIDNLTVSGATCTSTVIQNRLRETHGITITKPTLIRQLKKTGLKFTKGNRVNKEHESAANVAYRKKYVQERLSNLDENGVPIRPEVFLDESYIHVNHNLSRGWVDPDKNVYQQEKGAMLVIFGAFVVYRNEQGTTQAGFVEDHIINWPAEGGNRLQEGVRRGRPFKDQDQWLTAVPPEVLETKTVPRTHDYHGYFNGGTFEKLFTRMCNKLNELGHRNCIIHMDGASYHVRNTERAPSKSANKPTMVAWLKQQLQMEREMEDNNCDDREEEADPDFENMSKAQLFELIEQRTEGKEVQFNTYQIASDRGHTILKTPPYHCELQPIEKVWAVSKNQVAAQDMGSETILTVHRKLNKVFSEITSDTFVSLWQETVNTNREYALQ